MRISILIFVFISVAGCAGNSNIQHVYNPEPSINKIQQWSNAIGTWEGKSDIESGGSYSWIIERHSNGTFELHGIVKEASGDVVHQLEVGEWGIDGGIYFVSPKGTIEDGVFIPFDNTNPHYFQAYRILEASQDYFVIQLITTGDVFKTKRYTKNHDSNESKS